jgi:hypothetical protein
MDPLNVSCSIPDIPKDLPIEDVPYSSQTLMQVTLLGRKIFTYGVEYLKDKKRVESANKRWREEAGVKWTGDITQANLFKLYVPLMAEGTKGKEIVYVDTLDLLGHFQITQLQLRKMIEINDIDTEKQIIEKKQLMELLNINGTSSLDEPSQAELVQSLLSKLVEHYEQKPTSEEARLARVAMLLNSKISKKIYDCLVLREGFRPFKAADHVGTKAYKLVFQMRSELSTTTELSAEGIRAKSNLQMADKFILEWIEDPKRQTISADDIKGLNWIICNGLKNNGGTPGEFRKKDKEVVAGGDIEHAYIKGKDVEGEMKLFFEWLNTQLAACRAGTISPVIVAALAYQRLVTIHPFMDGNGRTCRMVMDFILMKFGLPPAAMEDPKVAIFPRLKETESVMPAEAILKVKHGIIVSSEAFGFGNPFVVFRPT